MKKKNIVFLILNKYSGRGGTERALVNIVTGLYKFNVNSSLIFMEQPEHLDFLEELSVCTSVIIYKEKKTRSAFFKKAYYQKFLKKSLIQLSEITGLDSIIVLDFSKNLIRSFDTLKFFKKQSDCQVIGWPHVFLSDMEAKEFKALRKAVSIFDTVLAVSKGMQQNITHIYPEKKIKILGNPIKKSNLIQRDKNKFLFLGRIDDPNKGFLPLLQSLGSLTGPWVLDVYGGIDSFQLKSEIEKECMQSGISGNVNFHGWQNKPWDNISSAGVLLLNSQRETFGLVLVEAMMRGVPCISTDCPTGPREIITDNINGWLVDPTRSSEMLEIMQSIINGDILLPEPKEVQASVSCYVLENIVRQFNNYL